jgi:hypothetical protein
MPCVYLHKSEENYALLPLFNTSFTPHVLCRSNRPSITDYGGLTTVDQVAPVIRQAVTEFAHDLQFSILQVGTNVLIALTIVAVLFFIIWSTLQVVVALKVGTLLKVKAQQERQRVARQDHR